MAGWECDVCTFINEDGAAFCDMCSGPRPAAGARSRVEPPPVTADGRTDSAFVDLARGMDGISQTYAVQKEVYFKSIDAVAGQVLAYSDRGDVAEWAVSMYGVAVDLLVNQGEPAEENGRICRSVILHAVTYASRALSHGYVKAAATVLEAALNDGGKYFYYRVPHMGTVHNRRDVYVEATMRVLADVVPPLLERLAACLTPAAPPGSSPPASAAAAIGEVALPEPARVQRTPSGASAADDDDEDAAAAAQVETFIAPLDTRDAASMNVATWGSLPAIADLLQLLCVVANALHKCTEYTSPGGHVILAPALSEQVAALMPAYARCTELLTATCVAIAALPDDLLRKDLAASGEAFKNVFTFLGLLYRAEEPFPHRFKLHVLATALTSKSMQRQLWALDMLTDLVQQLKTQVESREATWSDQHARAQRVLDNVKTHASASITGAVTGINSDIWPLTATQRAPTAAQVADAEAIVAAPRPPRTLPPSTHMIAQWLTSRYSRFMDLLREDAHEQVLKRAEPLCALLAKHRCLTAAHTDGLIDALLTGHAAAADERRLLLAAIAREAAGVSPDLVHHIYARLRAALDHPHQFAEAVQIIAKLAKGLQDAHRRAEKEVEADSRFAVGPRRRPTHVAPVTDLEVLFTSLMYHTITHMRAPTLGLTSTGLAEDVNAVAAAAAAEMAAAAAAAADDDDANVLMGADDAIESVTSAEDEGRGDNGADDDFPSAGFNSSASAEGSPALAPLVVDTSAAPAASTDVPSSPTRRVSLPMPLGSPLLTRARSSAMDAAGVFVDHMAVADEENKLTSVHASLAVIEDTFVLALERTGDASNSAAYMELCVNCMAGISRHRRAAADAGVLERLRADVVHHHTSSGGGAFTPSHTRATGSLESVPPITPGTPGAATHATIGMEGHALPAHVLEHVSTLSPSHDRVPRLLQLIKRVLTHMRGMGFTLRPAGGSDQADGRLEGVEVRNLSMHELLADCHAALSLPVFVFEEVCSYARYTPWPLLSVSGLQKRFNVLFTILRYSHVMLTSDSVRAMWSAVNQWPSTDVLMQAHTDVTSAMAEVRAKGVPASDALLAAARLHGDDTALLYPEWLQAANVIDALQHKQVAVVPELHASREVFWAFLRRALGGGAYDLVKSLRASPSTHALLQTPPTTVIAPADDPEDLVPSLDSSMLYVRPSHMVSQPWVPRATSILDPTDLHTPLIDPAEYINAWDDLFELSDASPAPPALAASPSEVRSGTSGVPAGVASPTRVLTPGRGGGGSGLSSPARSPVRAAPRTSDLPPSQTLVLAAMDKLLQVDLNRLLQRATVRASAAPEFLGPAGFAATQLAFLLRNMLNSDGSVRSHTSDLTSSAIGLRLENVRLSEGAPPPLPPGATSMSEKAAPSASHAVPASDGVIATAAVEMPPLSSHSPPPSPLRGLQWLIRLATHGPSAAASRAASLLVDAHAAVAEREAVSFASERLVRTAEPPRRLLPPLAQHPLVASLCAIIRSELATTSAFSRGAPSAADADASHRWAQPSVIVLARCVSILQTYVRKVTLRTACAVLAARDAGRRSAVAPTPVFSEESAIASLPAYLQSHRQRCGDVAGADAAAAPARTGLARSVSADVAAAAHGSSSTVTPSATMYGVGDAGSVGMTASTSIPGTHVVDVTVRFSPTTMHSSSRVAEVIASDAFSTEWFRALVLSEREYELFFTLLASDVCRSSSSMREQVWQLLMDLPTAPSFESALTSPAAVDWNLLLLRVRSDGVSDTSHALAAATPGSNDGSTDGAGDAWRSLYGLQAVAARLRDSAPGDSMASAPAAALKWRSDFVAANGLRVVIQQLVRAAPPKEWLATQRSRGKASAFTPAATSTAFDPRLAYDITNIAMRIVRLCSRDVREKDLAFKPVRGRAVKADAGLRLLVSRLLQVSWLASQSIGMPKRHPSVPAGARTPTAAVAASSNEPADATDASTSISAFMTLMQLLTKRPDLTSMCMLAAGTRAEGSSDPLPPLNPITIELLQRPETHIMAGDLLVCRFKDVRAIAAGVLKEFVRVAGASPSRTAAASSPVATQMGALVVAIVQGVLRRAPPTLEHGKEMCDLIVDLTSSARTLVCTHADSTTSSLSASDTPSTARVAASWFAFLAEIISDWWLVAATAARAGAAAVAAPTEVPSISVSSTSSASASPSAPTPVSMAPPSTRSTVLDTPHRAHVARWNPIAPKPLLRSVLLTMRTLLSDVLSAPRPEPTAAGLRRTPSDGLYEVSVAMPALIYTSSSTTAASTGDKVVVHVPARELLYEVASVLCLYGPEASEFVTPAATEAPATVSDGIPSGPSAASHVRGVHLCVDQADRDAGFTILRAILNSVYTARVDADTGLPAPADAALYTGMLSRVAQFALGGALTSEGGVPNSLSLVASISEETVISEAAAERRIARLFDAVEETFDASDWHYSPADASKADVGFVGLENLGCTCYLNSLVQQLFMHPRMRSIILNVEHSVPAALVADSAQRVVQTSTVVEEDVTLDTGKPSASSSAAASTADAGTGATSTADATVDAGRTPADGRAAGSGVPESKDSGSSDKTTANGGAAPLLTLTTEEKQMQLLLELQRTFLWLQEGHVKAYAPRRLVESCRVLGLPNDVLQQNDAMEFGNKLLEALETRLRAADAGSVANAMMRLLSGKQCTRKHRGCCDRVDVAGDTPFSFLSVNVSDESLAGCLQRTFEEQVLSGDNAVECPHCERKSTTRIQECLSELPSLLIIHLKRFATDFTDPAYRTVKVNSRVAFPMVLDMSPYTVAGLRARRSRGARARRGTSSVDVVSRMTTSSGDIYDLVGVLVHSGTAQAGHYYSYIREHSEFVATAAPSDGAAREAPAPKRGRARTPRWYLFDDRNVCQYDPARLPGDTFGGTETVRKVSRDYPYHDVMVEQPLTRNALLLFYERRSAAPAGTPAPTSDGTTSSEATARASTDAAPAPTPMASAQEALAVTRKLMSTENVRSARHAFAFDACLRTFLAGCASDRITQLLQRMTSDASVEISATERMQNLMIIGVLREQQLQTEAEALRSRGENVGEALLLQPAAHHMHTPDTLFALCVHLLLSVVMRLKEQGPDCEQLGNSVNDMMVAYPNCARWFLLHVSGGAAAFAPSTGGGTSPAGAGPPPVVTSSWLAKGLVFCTNATSRKLLARLLRTALEVVSRNETSGNPFTPPPEPVPVPAHVHPVPAREDGFYSGDLIKHAAVRAGLQFQMHAAIQLYRSGWERAEAGTSVAALQRAAIDRDVVAWMQVDAARAQESAAKAAHADALAELRAAKAAEEVTAPQLRGIETRLREAERKMRHLEDLVARMKARLRVEAEAQAAGRIVPELSAADDIDFSRMDPAAHEMDSDDDGYDSAFPRGRALAPVRSKDGQTLRRLRKAERALAALPNAIAVDVEARDKLQASISAVSEGGEPVADRVERARAMLDAARVHREGAVYAARVSPGPASVVTALLASAAELFAVTGEHAMDKYIDRLGTLLEMIQAARVTHETMPQLLCAQAAPSADGAPPPWCLTDGDAAQWLPGGDVRDARVLSTPARQRWEAQYLELNRAVLEATGPQVLLALMGLPLAMQRLLLRVAEPDTSLIFRAAPKVAALNKLYTTMVEAPGMLHAPAMLADMVHTDVLDAHFGHALRMSGLHEPQTVGMNLAKNVMIQLAARSRRDILTGRVLAFLVHVPGATRPIIDADEHAHQFPAGASYGIFVLVTRAFDDMLTPGSCVPTAADVPHLQASSSDALSLPTHILVPTQAAQAAVSRIPALATVPQVVVDDIPADVSFSGAAPVAQALAMGMVTRLHVCTHYTFCILNSLFQLASHWRASYTRALLLEHVTLGAVLAPGTHNVLRLVSLGAVVATRHAINSLVPVGGLLANLTPHGRKRSFNSYSASLLSPAYRDTPYERSRMDMHACKGLLQLILLNYMRGPQELESRLEMQRLRWLWLSMPARGMHPTTNTQFMNFTNADVIVAFKGFDTDAEATLREHPGAPRALPQWKDNELLEEYHASACCEAWSCFHVRATLLAELRTFMRERSGAFVAAMQARLDALNAILRTRRLALAMADSPHRVGTASAAAPSASAAAPAVWPNPSLLNPSYPLHVPADGRAMLVRGAGLKIANGLYVDSGRVSGGAPVYERRLGSFILSLLRIRPDSQPTRVYWFISALSGVAYRRHAHDLYRVDATAHPEAPPTVGWGLGEHNMRCTCHHEVGMHTRLHRLTPVGPAPSVVAFTAEEAVAWTAAVAQRVHTAAPPAPAAVAAPVPPASTQAFSVTLPPRGAGTGGARLQAPAPAPTLTPAQQEMLAQDIGEVSDEDVGVPAHPPVTPPRPTVTGLRARPHVNAEHLSPSQPPLLVSEPPLLPVNETESDDDSYTALDEGEPSELEMEDMIAAIVGMGFPQEQARAAVSRARRLNYTLDAVLAMMLDDSEQPQ